MCKRFAQLNIYKVSIFASFVCPDINDGFSIVTCFAGNILIDLIRLGWATGNKLHTLSTYWARQELICKESYQNAVNKDSAYKREKQTNIHRT